MLWNIAFKTLLSDRGKLLAGLIGVVFSIVLVNIQGGLFSGLMSKATLLVDRGNADIWVGNKGMHNVDFAHDIPERWVHRIRSIPGVEEAEPIRISFSEMMLPSGEYESVLSSLASNRVASWATLGTWSKVQKTRSTSHTA